MNSTLNGKEWLKYIGLINTAIMYLIYIPVMLHGFYRMHQNRRHSFIVKRYINLALISVGSVPLLMLSLGLIQLCISDLIIVSNKIIFLGVNICISYIIFFLLIACQHVRFWMNFFNVKWTHYILQQNWKQIIEPSVLTNNWYINHKKDYGQFSFVSKWMFIFHLIFAIVSSILFIIPVFIIHVKYFYVSAIIITIVILGFPFIFLTTLQCKMKKDEENKKINFNDNCYIGWEQEMAFKPAAIANISFLVHCILIALLNVKYLPILGTTLIFTFSTATFAIAVIATHCTVDKITTGKSCSCCHFYNLSQQLMIEIHASSRSNHNDKNQITLIDILKNIDTFDYLMRYLATEFSMEVLLSWLEIYQYQIYVISQCNNSDDSVLDLDNIELYNDMDICMEKLPHSVIVYDDNKSLYEKARMIYEKYMNDGSEYEINISWKLRNKLRETMVDSTSFDDERVMTKQDLLELFEECKMEMLQLLGYSHDRFKQMDEYQQIRDILL